MNRYKLVFLCICFSLKLVGQCNFTVHAGPDVTVCNPGDVGTLSGRITGNPLDIEWVPADGLSNPKSPVTRVTVQGQAEYILKAKGLDPTNLIVNGNFNGGRSGFTTDYRVGSTPCYGLGYLDCEGTYDVINNPRLGHSGFAQCGDHTTGTGNMMVINGSANLQNVWCQRVAVMPSTEYIFAVWVTSVVSASPPILQVTFNGSPVGPTFNSSGNVCRWEKHEVTWNSGGASSAQICIINENLATNGNDFALDDISLQKICELRDTAVVNVEEIAIDIHDPEIVTCKKPKIKLNAKGSTHRRGYTFQWTTTDGKIVSGDKTLEPEIQGPGTYTLLVCNPVIPCCKEQSVTVHGNINPPKITLSLRDSLGCGKSSVTIKTKIDNPDVDYEWKGPNGFEFRDKDPRVSAAGKYVLRVEDGYECVSYDSIHVVEHKDNPKVDIFQNPIDCRRDSAFLKVQSSVSGSSFEWTGPGGNTKGGDEWVVTDSGRYVLRTSTPLGCIRYDTIVVSKNINKPQLQYSTDTLNCLKDTAQIVITTHDSISNFEWKAPGRFFGSGGLNIAALDAGDYLLEVTGHNGCKNEVVVTVLSDTARPYLSYQADTITCRKSSARIQIVCTDSLAILEWSGKDAPSQSIPVFETRHPGWYRLISKSKNGCADSIRFEVQVDTIRPHFMLHDDTVNCAIPIQKLRIEGDTARLQFGWRGPQGFASQEFHPQVNSPGLYVFEAYYSNGCGFIDSLYITGDFTKPKLEAKDDTLSCIKDSVLLIAGSDKATTLFQWRTPSGSIFYEKQRFVQQEGVYILKGRNENGCEDSIAVTVYKDVRKPELYVANDTFNCKKPFASLHGQSNRDTLQYIWTGPNGFSAGTKEIVVRDAGAYTLTIVTEELCKAVFEAMVIADTMQPKLSLRGDTLNCIKTHVRVGPVNPDPGLKYNWSGPGMQDQNSEQINVTVGGRYTLLATAQNGCTASAFVDVLADTARPDISVANDTINCKDTIAIISPSSTAALLKIISPSGGITINAPLRTKIPGAYTIEATGVNGCVGARQAFVEIDTLRPFAHIDYNGIDCNQRISKVTATPSPANSLLLWLGPAGFRTVSGTFSTVTGGHYLLKLEANNGCTAEQSIEIPIDTAAPKIEVGADTIDCTRKQALVIVKGDILDNTVSWTDESRRLVSEKPSFFADKSGWYHAEVINPKNGCASYASSFVYEDPDFIKDVIIETAQPKCGEPFGHINAVRVMGGHRGFEYSVDQKQTWQSTPVFNALREGNYTLHVRDSKQCEFAKDFTIASEEFVQTHLPPSVTIELGDSVRLKVTVNLPIQSIRTVLWSPNLNLSCHDCLDPMASPLSNTEYTVTVIDTNGCISRSKIWVKVELPEVWVPNVFSPNGDNLNDVVWIHSSQENNVDVLRFSIYDRWGQQIFHDQNFKPNNPNRAWDGRYKNRPCTPGVYVYIAEIQLKDGLKRWIKGDITLVR